jgi:hypothetical protein
MDVHIAVNFLKPAKLAPSKKYGHVKSGKINPPKSSFSLKPATEKKIKKYEDNVKNITLYAHRVNLKNSDFCSQKKREISPIRENKNNQEYHSDEDQNFEGNLNYNSTNPNPEIYKNVVVIGQAPGYQSIKTQQVNSSQFNNSQVHNQTFNRSINKGNYNQRHIVSASNSISKQKMYPGEKIRESSRDGRNILKKYENFYSNTKDFFISNSNKIPSKKGIHEIIQNAEEMRASLENYKLKLIEKEREKEMIFNNSNLSINKSSFSKHSPVRNVKSKNDKLGRKIIKPRSPKKYLEINPEERRKIEEKLESLHVEIRMIFDSMSGMEEKNAKIEELIRKSHNLSNLLKSFSERLNTGSGNNFNNMTIHEELGEGEIDKDRVNLTLNETKHNLVNSIMTQSLNLGNTQTNQLIPSNKSQDKRNEVDEVIEVLKGSMMNLQVDDNKMQFDSQLQQGSFYNLNNQSIGNNFMTTANQNLYNYSNNNFNKTAQLSNFSATQGIAGLKGNHEGYGTQSNFNNYSSNNFNTTQKSLNQNSTPTGNNFNQSANVNIGTNSLNNNFFNSNNQSLTNTQYISQAQSPELLMTSGYNSNSNFMSPLATQGTGQNFQNLEQTAVENSNSQFISQSQYPKINFKNVTRDDRFSAYEVEMPINYYYNLTKTNEPNPGKEWYLRPHHTETTSKSPNAIADDILNTKYISYYAPNEKQEVTKNREEHLSDVISNLEYNIDKLKKELYTKSVVDKNFGKIYNQLENMKEEVKKDYVPGKVFEKLLSQEKGQNKNLGGVADVNSQNENVKSTNMVISSYETLLKELREKEKEILLKKRKDQFEKIRPPLEKWWELRGGEFKEELERNKMIINANQDYYRKLEELENNQLY